MKRSDEILAEINILLTKMIELRDEVLDIASSIHTDSVIEIEEDDEEYVMAMLGDDTYILPKDMAMTVRPDKKKMN